MAGRIARHLRPDKRLRWHIDYLLQFARVLEVLTIETDRRLECRLSRAAARLSDEVVMPGFGASDCGCRTHLHYFRRDPRARLGVLVDGLRARFGRPAGTRRTS